jgi:hypothetical protein
MGADVVVVVRVCVRTVAAKLSRRGVDNMMQ